MDNKKTSTEVDELIELLKRLNERDIKLLYYIIIGFATDRGYKVLNS